MNEGVEALVVEAVERNVSLETLADEGLGAFERAGTLARMVVRDLVRRGVGMSLDDLRTRIRHASTTLRALLADEVRLQDVRPELEEYAVLVRRTVRFVEGLEPMAGRIRDEAQRQAVLSMARERLADARRLAELLDTIVAGGDEHA